MGGNMSMSKKKKTENKSINLVEELQKYLPQGLVPNSYIEYLLLEADDYADSKEELIGNVKIDLADQTGIDIPMTRKEAEEYLLEDIDDEQWKAMSDNDLISSRQVKMMEEYSEKTMLELIKEMPLIPASRLVSSIIISYLKNHGMEITPQREEEIAEDIIYTLNSSFDDMETDMSDDDEDIQLEWEDGFDPDLDWDDDDDDDDDDEDVVFETDDFEKLPDDVKEVIKESFQRKKRRSRITKFPGKKN